MENNRSLILEHYLVKEVNGFHFCLCGESYIGQRTFRKHLGQAQMNSVYDENGNQMTWEESIKWQKKKRLESNGRGNMNKILLMVKA